MQQSKKKQATKKRTKFDAVAHVRRIAAEPITGDVLAFALAEFGVQLGYSEKSAHYAAAQAMAAATIDC